MNNDREPGRTFAPEDIGWIDFECRSPEDIKAGTARYMTEADAIICTFAIGDGPLRCVAGQRLRRAAALGRHAGPTSATSTIASWRGEAKWCAWNAGFDRAIWNLRHARTSRMLSRAHHRRHGAGHRLSGLPPGLKMAARVGQGHVKVEEGKDLIKLFCLPGAQSVRGTPQSHPEEWQHFRRLRDRRHRRDARGVPGHPAAAAGRVAANTGRWRPSTSAASASTSTWSSTPPGSPMRTSADRRPSWPS